MQNVKRKTILPRRAGNQSFSFFAFHFSFSRSGFGIIEIVVVTAIVTLALAGFLETGALAVHLLRAEKENLEASLLAQETLEAARTLRDESWTNNIVALTIGATYYPVIENGKWKLTSANPGIINGKYTRTVTLNQVFRDTQDRIATSGTLDPNTKKITAAVSWGTKTTQMITYLTNFLSLLPQQQESKIVYFEDAPTDSNFANFPSNNAGDGDPAQSFTNSASSTQITKIELFLRRATTTPSNIYLELRSSVTGSVLGTANEINSTTIATSSLSWIEFRFPVPVSLAASVKYFIRLRSDPSSTDAGSGSLGPLDWGYRQTPSSPYAGGEAYTGIGRLSNPNDGGIKQSQYDFGFRVFALQ